VATFVWPLTGRPSRRAVAIAPQAVLQEGRIGQAGQGVVGGAALGAGVGPRVLQRHGDLLRAGGDPVVYLDGPPTRLVAPALQQYLALWQAPSQRSHTRFCNVRIANTQLDELLKRLELHDARVGHVCSKDMEFVKRL